MKNAFNNKNKNQNWNKDKWDKKENNPSSGGLQNPVQKETSSQESSMGKYVREENTNKNENSAPNRNNKR